MCALLLLLLLLLHCCPVLQNPSQDDGNVRPLPYSSPTCTFADGAYE
jgi:hypothetical protein